jgi:hypothetical protein
MKCKNYETNPRNADGQRQNISYRFTYRNQRQQKSQETNPCVRACVKTTILSCGAGSPACSLLSAGLFVNPQEPPEEAAAG